MKIHLKQTSPLDGARAGENRRQAIAYGEQLRKGCSINQDAERRHRRAAKRHCESRIPERLNRKANKLSIDKMRLAFLKNNKDCFMIEETYDDALIGIVKYENIWTRAVFDRTLGVVVTVGV